MALSRVNEFDTGSTLTETKLEGEFDNIYNNPLSLISPLTGALDTGATGQIIFPATQTASAGANTLDDYEEGTWTPVLTFATPGDLSVAYSSRAGRYTKIGRLVQLNFSVLTSTFTHTTASGTLRVTGLPFTSATTASHIWVGPLAWTGFTLTATDIACQIDSASSIIIFLVSVSATVLANVVAAQVPTAGTVQLYGSVAYEAA